MAYFIWQDNGAPYMLADFDNSTITFQNNPNFSGAFIKLTGGAFQFRQANFVNAFTVAGVKGILNNYSTIDISNSFADGAPLVRSNFPGNSVFQFPQGQSTIAPDTVFFRDLCAPTTCDGLIQSIQDSDVNTWSTVVAGGGIYPADVISLQGNWRVLAVGSASTSPALVLNDIERGIASGGNSHPVVRSVGASILVVALVVCTHPVPMTISTLTDSAGNTYAKAIESAGIAGSANGSLWWAIITNPIVSGSTTFSATTSSGQSFAICVMVAPGYTGGSDKTATNSSNAAGVSVSTGALSTASEIVIGAFVPDNFLTSFAEGSGFTSLDPSSAAAGFGDIAYKIVNATTTVTYAPSWSNATNNTAVIASFK